MASSSAAWLDEALGLRLWPMICLPKRAARRCAPRQLVARKIAEEPGWGRDWLSTPIGCIILHGRRFRPGRLFGRGKAPRRASEALEVGDLLRREEEADRAIGYLFPIQRKRQSGGK